MINNTDRELLHMPVDYPVLGFFPMILPNHPAHGLFLIQSTKLHPLFMHMQAFLPPKGMRLMQKKSINI